MLENSPQNEIMENISTNFRKINHRIIHMSFAFSKTEPGIRKLMDYASRTVKNLLKGSMEIK